jgi:hypothetical protein
MNDRLIFILCVAIAIICAINLRNIAMRREANHQFWFYVGLILGPLGFVFMRFIKNKNTSLTKE